MSMFSTRKQCLVAYMLKMDGIQRKYLLCCCCCCDEYIILGIFYDFSNCIKCLWANNVVAYDASTFFTDFIKYLVSWRHCCNPHVSFIATLLYFRGVHFEVQSKLQNCFHFLFIFHETFLRIILLLRSLSCLLCPIQNGWDCCNFFDYIYLKAVGGTENWIVEAMSNSFSYSWPVHCASYFISFDFFGQCSKLLSDFL